MKTYRLKLIFESPEVLFNAFDDIEARKYVTENIEQIKNKCLKTFKKAILLRDGEKVEKVQLNRI